MLFSSFTGFVVPEERVVKFFQEPNKSQTNSTVMKARKKKQGRKAKRDFNLAKET